MCPCASPNLKPPDLKAHGHRIEQVIDHPIQEKHYVRPDGSGTDRRNRDPSLQAEKISGPDDRSCPRPGVVQGEALFLPAIRWVNRPLDDKSRPSGYNSADLRPSLSFRLFDQRVNAQRMTRKSSTYPKFQKSGSFDGS